MADVEVLDGRYRLTHRLGAGAMGEVYRAERIWLGDEVAIKFVRSEAGEPTEAHDRFMFEGQLAARLRHPSIVTVFDFGIDRVRGPFLVMEYLNGPTLAQEIAASGPFEVARAIDILDDLASALDLAHASGLVHRDLKPANIVAHRLSNGEVLYKIIDFGIGALLKEASEETTIDRAPFIGSLAYAAPEQLLGEAVDGHADIYSLGALTFEMLTGRVPFAEQNLSALLTRIIGSVPPKPGTLRPGLDQHVDEAVLTALERREHRFVHMLVEPRPERARLRRHAADNARQQRTEVLLGKRYTPGEHLEGQRTQTVDVGMAVNGLSQQLLRCGIRQRADEGRTIDCRLFAGFLQERADSEVDDLVEHFTVAQPVGDDVRGLQVAMHKPAGMGEIKGGCEVVEDIDRPRHLERP
jgi:serine/threonine-protein kinase